MKKIISLALVVILALSALVSCTGGSGSTTTTTQNPASSANIKYFLDGASAESVAKGNYVVYVYAKSDTSKWVAWDYEAWTVKDAASDVEYTAYMFSVDSLYNSAEELEAATGLTPGMKVGTKSYHAGKGRGAALYTVVESKPSTTGWVKISGSSAYAELKPFDVDGEKVVTVDQFGAYGDGDKGDHVEISSAINFPTATLVEFESDAYMQTATIRLSRGNIKVNGKGAEIRNRYETHVVNDDFIIAPYTDDIIENIILENLTLKCTEDTGAGALYNKADHVQLRVSKTHHITVRDCSMLVPQNHNTEPLQVASVWMSENISDILFENNYLQNFSDSGMGGGLWFSASSGTAGCKNLIVRGNHVEKNSCDEVFALFFGDFEDVLIENNCFYTHSHVYPDRISDNGIGFGVWGIETHCKNVKFSNNTVIMSLRFTPFIFSQADNVEISDNKIYLTTNFGDQQSVEEITIIEKAIFRLPESNKYSVTNTKIHGNYIEVNCGKFTQNGYNLNALTEGMSESVEYYDNIFVLNCIVNKFIGDNDKSKFYNNTITVNGSLLNNNFSIEAQNDNTITVN